MFNRIPLVLMMLLATSMAFVSCSKDDEDDDKNTTTPNIVELAQADPNFSTLVAALTRPGLSTDYVTTLSGTGPFTVFAPTNDAFAALLTELSLTSLDDVPTATLEAVLNYHVVSGNVLAGSLTEGQVVTPLAGGTFTIGLSGGAKITDGSNRVTNIIATDVKASNGVIHAIDRVLVPAP
jgi:transforming growth factor-beta-induced protein